MSTLASVTSIGALAALSSPLRFSTLLDGSGPRRRLADRVDPSLGTLPRDAVIRARAPLRLNLGGAGTDLLPYAEEHGGLVLSATIKRYAHATLRLNEEGSVQVRSLDDDAVLSLGLDDPLIYDGRFDLVKACLRRLRVGAEGRHGLEMYLQTDAPPGSGLGASSAVVVATIGALATWRRLRLTDYEIAALAYELERTDVGIPGGMQDHYATAFGGFNLTEFDGRRDVVVTPLRVEVAMASELEYNSLLVFTGASRLSSRIIESQVSGTRQGDPQVLAAFEEMKALALAAKKALLRGQVMELGRVLHEQWVAKKRTSPGVATARADALYDAARQAGAIGGLFTGAGGGGFMLLVCPFERRPSVSGTLRRLGCHVSNVEFEPAGLQSWVVPATSPVPEAAGGIPQRGRD